MIENDEWNLEGDRKRLTATHLTARFKPIQLGAIQLNRS